MTRSILVVGASIDLPSQVLGVVVIAVVVCVLLVSCYQGETIHLTDVHLHL